MINADAFYSELVSRGVGIFTGVPDSILKPLCTMLEALPAHENIVAANEGNALALAAGHYLATGKTGVVYLQNSGLGNCMNPLASLSHPDVYSIPMLLLIGWRGEPGVKDEPQHITQGRITEEQLRLLDIPCHYLQEGSDLTSVLDQTFESISLVQGPVALLVSKNCFAPYPRASQRAQHGGFTREDILEVILDLTGTDHVFISTTGFTSREIYELRERRKESHRDFLTVGSMGHASSIALGVALGNPKKQVICLDGDGAATMHMGALATIGKVAPPNLVHIILNNGIHESVGGMPTASSHLSFAETAKTCGYPTTYYTEDINALKDIWHKIQPATGPQLLEIRTPSGFRKDMGRPSQTLKQMKTTFMETVGDNTKP